MSLALKVQPTLQASPSEAAARQDKWDRRYLALAAQIATWSKDPSTKVGAVLVLGNRIVGTGFNGFPAGEPDDPELYADRAYKYAHVVHAEINAIRQRTPGSTLYTSFPMCPDCARKAIGAGVVRFVFPPLPREGRSEEWIAQWTAWMQETIGLAELYNVRVSIRH